MKKCIFGLILILGILEIQAATWINRLKILLSNRIECKLILQSVRGDLLIQVDSVQQNKNEFVSTFPNNFPVGVYRMLFVSSSKVKNKYEIVRQQDIIVNHEDIELTINTTEPPDILTIVRSVENEVWIHFKLKEADFQKEQKELEIEIDFFRKHGTVNPDAKSEFDDRVKKFNQIQTIRNDLIDHILAQYPNLFVSKVILLNREPFQDGAFTKEERRIVFKKEYLNQLDFNDSTLINSTVLTDKVYRYLMSYSQKGLNPQQQEAEFNIAGNLILEKCSSNKQVKDFIYQYINKILKIYNFRPLTL